MTGFTRRPKKSNIVVTSQKGIPSPHNSEHANTYTNKFTVLMVK